MTIRLSQVKSLCTASELTLVKASRRPEVDKLTGPQLKRNADRARKLLDKWRDQTRSQARDRKSEVGVAEERERSRLKVEIFQEALSQFEARLAKLAAAGTPAIGRAPATTPKKKRSLTHRATRAEVRGELKAKKVKLNKQARGAKKAAQKTAKKSTSARNAPQKS